MNTHDALQTIELQTMWHRLIALDPTDEQAQCALMQAALDAGNRVEAIRLFKQLRDNLRAELGVGPSAATIALYEKALALSCADTATASDRIGASLAWGLVHLQSGEFDKAGEIARQTRDMALGAGLAREVERELALARVGGVEERRELPRAVAHRRVGRTHARAVGPLYRLDLHHVGAEEAEDLRRVRARPVRREVEHAQTLERTRR